MDLGIVFLIVIVVAAGGGALIWFASRGSSRRCGECQRNLPSNLDTCPFCGALVNNRTFIEPFPTTRLSAIDGPREGQEFMLRGEQVTIGRAPQSDIRLDDDLVSWEHAVLTFSDGEYVLYDRDSTNGTWVNGRRIAQATISPGQDQIRIGPSIFVLQVAGQPQQIPSPLPEPVPARVPVEKVYDFGEYERIATLGGGGAALVYKAVSKRDGETVAVKVFNRSDPYLRDKFQKEGREIAQMLRHPHIVRVYGGGNSNGVLYLVMEFMDGGTLRERLYPGRPLSYEQIVSITGQICDALQYAHRAGVYHRDIKPENMFFSSDGTVKLGDFGIARLAQSVTRTVSGVLLGTPAYMSYEQAKGHDIDGRSDLYALGVVLYEMVTGRCPFKADNPLALVEKHIRESPIPPSRINPAVSPQVEGVIMRALEKDRNRRFSNAEEMARAIGYAGPMHDGEMSASPSAPASNAQAGMQVSIPSHAGVSRLVRLDGYAIQLRSSVTNLNRRNVNPDDIEISRDHARVVRREENYWIEDLGSSNGTFVNGLRLFDAQILKPGDEIRLGRTVLHVES
jgi:serine/threonine protein kinase